MYMLSMTMKDCSVFVRLPQTAPKPVNDGSSAVLQGVDIKLIDLDLKPISRLRKYIARDAEVLSRFKKLLDSVVQPVPCLDLGLWFPHVQSSVFTFDRKSSLAFLEILFITWCGWSSWRIFCILYYSVIHKLWNFSSLWKIGQIGLGFSQLSVARHTVNIGNFKCDGVYPCFDIQNSVFNLYTRDNSYGYSMLTRSQKTALSSAGSVVIVHFKIISRIWVRVTPSNWTSRGSESIRKGKSIPQSKSRWPCHSKAQVFEF